MQANGGITLSGGGGALNNSILVNGANLIATNGSSNIGGGGTGSGSLIVERTDDGAVFEYRQHGRLVSLQRFLLPRQGELEVGDLLLAHTHPSGTLYLNGLGRHHTSPDQVEKGGGEGYQSECWNYHRNL